MLMWADQSCLVIVDVQEKLCPVMDEPRKVLEGCKRLIQGAGIMEVPVIVTEQYPKGLGPTMVDIRQVAPEDSYVEKLSFSAADEPKFMERFTALGRNQVVIAGVEAHVCVLQTAFRLAANGKKVFVVRDACSSRTVKNEQAAYERLRTNGVELVTTEMVLFEWLGKAGTDQFKAIQKLVV